MPSLSERFLPDGDVVIATAWQTAEWVSQYRKSRDAVLLYSALGNLEWTKESVRNWRTRLQKIVAIVAGRDCRDLGETMIYIPTA